MIATEFWMSVGLIVGVLIAMLIIRNAKRRP